MVGVKKDRKTKGAFDYTRISRAVKKIPMICVYDHPADYPGKYVARLWDGNEPTRFIALADTIENIRKIIPPNMMRVLRAQQDDPCIVEIWI